MIPSRERDHQKALVMAIKLLGRRRRVRVVWINNQARPPKGVRRGTAAYHRWFAALVEMGFDPGITDLLIHWPGPVEGGPELCLFIECKRPGDGKLSAGQKDWHRQADRERIPAFVWEDGEPRTALKWLREKGCPI